MKKNWVILVVVASLSMMACKVRYGCPATGRNVGAEKLISGDPKALKEVKRAKKFKGGM